MCDLGDIFTIPGNIEKSFDQITKAVSHVYASGAFPVVLGGDHSIGYPTVRAVAQHLGGGNLGIIHFDRHVDTQETDLDERMHTTPWFHATDIPNVPARNLVQIGIGGWQAPRPGVQGRPGAGHDDHDRHRLRRDGHRRRHRARPRGGVGRGRGGVAVASTSTASTPPSCPARAGRSRAGSCPARC